MFERCLEIIQDSVTPLTNDTDSGTGFHAEQYVDEDVMDTEFLDTSEYYLEDEENITPNKAIEVVASECFKPQTQEKFQTASNRPQLLRSVYGNISAIAQNQKQKIDHNKELQETIKQIKCEQHAIQMEILDQELKNAKMVGEKLDSEIRILKTKYNNNFKMQNK